MRTIIFKKITVQLSHNFTIYLSCANHLAVREREPDWIGFNTNPGSALLRPTKYHSETRGMFETHLELYLTLLHSTVEPQRISPSS